jgi:hypothetical protein
MSRSYSGVVVKTGHKNVTDCAGLPFFTAQVPMQTTTAQASKPAFSESSIPVNGCLLASTTVIPTA